uniref:Putative secreted protein n=1 Tax=Ixodes ricinus TaxID=34613 RepID=A0A6B0U6T0_IXORI
MAPARVVPMDAIVFAMSSLTTLTSGVSEASSEQLSKFNTRTCFFEEMHLEATLASDLSCGLFLRFGFGLAPQMMATAADF